MPRRRSATKPKATTPPPVITDGMVPVIPTNSMVASAVRYQGKSARIFQGAKNWQREVYRHLGICGEARYAAAYFGHAMARAQLYAADVVDGVLAELDAGSLESRTLGSLFHGEAGQSQGLYQIGFHLASVGECYLVGRSSGDGVDEQVRETGALPNPDAATEQDIWEVVSVVEMHVNGSAWSIRYGDDRPPVELTDEDIIIRIWTPHPEKRVEADSAFRSLLPVLTEIEWLTMHLFAQCRSRLAGAGLLIINQDMSFPAPPPMQDADGNDIPVDDLSQATLFMHVLGEAMMKPIEDQSNPAATIPVVASVPGEVLKEGKAAELIHFWSQLDDKVAELRKDAIARFALGMDLPPEKLLGMSSNPGTGGGTSNGVSHWGAWQVDEDTIKLHIEPMLEVVVNAITIGWLRPALGNTTAVVRYKTTKLRLRPDRSKEAFELWDRFLLSDAALFREVGFEPSDMAKDDEVKARVLRKVASGSATPEQVQAALKAMGIDLGVLQQPEAPTREARPDPSIRDHPTRDIPEREAASTRELVAASNALCFRALERAGNRLRQNVGKPPNCPAWEVHTMVQANGNADAVLADAFSSAELILSGIGDPTVVVPVLESYAATLIREQSPHDKERMTEWLTRAGAA